MIRINRPVYVLIQGRKVKGIVVGPKERKVTGRRVEFVWPVRIPGVGYTQRFVASIVTAA